MQSFLSGILGAFSILVLLKVIFKIGEYVSFLVRLKQLAERNKYQGIYSSKIKLEVVAEEPSKQIAISVAFFILYYVTFYFMSEYALNSYLALILSPILGIIGIYRRQHSRFLTIEKDDKQHKLENEIGFSDTFLLFFLAASIDLLRQENLPPIGTLTLTYLPLVLSLILFSGIAVAAKRSTLLKLLKKRDQDKTPYLGYNMGLENFMDLLVPNIAERLFIKSNEVVNSILPFSVPMLVLVAAYSTSKTNPLSLLISIFGTIISLFLVYLPSALLKGKFQSLEPLLSQIVYRYVGFREYFKKRA